MTFITSIARHSSTNFYELTCVLYSKTLMFSIVHVPEWSSSSVYKFCTSKIRKWWSERGKFQKAELCLLIEFFPYLFAPVISMNSAALVQSTRNVEIRRKFSLECNDLNSGELISKNFRYICHRNYSIKKCPRKWNQTEQV